MRRRGNGICSLALAIVTLCAAEVEVSAQQSPAPHDAPVAAPSAIMRPALSTLNNAVTGLRTDKWKIPTALRDETEANLNSVRRDLETTLPPLLSAADAAPAKVSELLPAYRNIEALYDVVLRVDSAARLGAPGQQSATLDQALLKLDEGRRGLGDRLLTNAQGQEKQVSDLQAAVRTAQSAPVPTPVCAPTPPPAKRKKPVAKAAAKPAIN